MPQEIYFRLNKLLGDGRATVTTTASQLLDIFTFDKDLIAQIKTFEVYNASTNDIYYGLDATTATATAGGIIKPETKIEIPMIDINYSPYFIASASSEILVTVWG